MHWLVQNPAPFNILYTNESFLKTHETLHVRTIEKLRILWVMNMDGLYGFYSLKSSPGTQFQLHV